MTRVVALSGGIGTGKSTVARMLAELGAVVIDADAIVHELQQPGEPLLDAMVEAFGREILTADGSLDREALGARVFRDAEARRRLEGLVHPRVGAEMARRLEAARAAGAPLAVLDIPLLFEGRRAREAAARERGETPPAEPQQTVVVVWVPEALQLERQIARDGRGRAAAEERIRAQLPIDEKRALADHVIDNAGSLARTERQVRALYAELTGAACSRTTASSPSP